MKKIRSLLIILFVLISAAKLFAEDATVTYVSGKVEVQRGSSWVAVKKGDTLSKSDMISTGFQSEAKIKILDSVLYLGPVTRITLEELSSKDNQDNVNVYLKTGTVRSQVRHVENKRVNYQVHTAIAVASCRGTGWIIDDSNNVTGLEGTLSVSAKKIGHDNDLVFDDGILLTANQTIKVTDDGVVTEPKSSVEDEAEQIIVTVDPEGINRNNSGAGASGTVEVTITGPDD